MGEMATSRAYGVRGFTKTVRLEAVLLPDMFFLCPLRILTA
jgi:hypothetical protein